MFDLGWAELLVIIVIAIIVVGPKQLPGLMRVVAKWLNKLKSMATDVQDSMRQMMKEAELEEINDQIERTKSYMKKPIKPLLDSVEQEVNIDKKTTSDHKPKKTKTKTVKKIKKENEQA